MGAILNFFRGIAAPRLRKVSVADLDPWRFNVDNGGKFPGGFGPTELLVTDYWTLRWRSAQLFEKNLYARGLVRRLVTNEINVGLHLECVPEEKILGRTEDSLADWSEDVENRFGLWAKNAAICDQGERLSFGALQAQARLEALVSGDVLIVLRQDPRTKLPRVQLISGDAVQTPITGLFPMPGQNRIVHGVELDKEGRQVAYWVRQDDLSHKRLPAYGEKSGRRLAWLMYGTEKRFRDVRGKPLLSIILQSLREIDRYRDAALRKAVINSIYALFVKKTQDKPGTRAITGGAVRKGQAAATTSPGAARVFNFTEQIPGAVIEELQVGEEPVPYSNAGTDVNFGPFEEAMLASIAWVNNVPPEIMKLAFSNNYSASQAAINEFKIYLNMVRTDFGEQFCQPIYVEWLLASALAGKVDAPSLLESFRDYSQHDTFGAWISADWTGQIKPAVDASKLGKGMEILIANGLITRDRAARETTGTKFSKNVKKLERENAALASANAPMAALKAAEKGAQPAEQDGPKNEPDDDAPDAETDPVDREDDVDASETEAERLLS